MTPTRAWRIWRECGRKVQFSSKAEALRRRMHGLRVYRCPHCRGWHATSQR